jgi:exodeoxyribonuclease V beta subunit
LIDECQDCDGVQIEVFQRLFIHNDGNELSTPAQPLTSAFVIGDPKQSIYRFRGADLASYQELVSQAQAAKDMRKNFRSDPDLVRQIDAAYQAGHAAFTPPADVADIPYVAVSAARTEDGLLDPRCSQALPVVWTDAEERTPAKFSIADRLAQECQRLLSDFVSIPDDKGDGEQRRLEAGDIAVLAHNHRDLGLIRRALQDRGIPVQQAGRGLSRLLDSDEARDWRDWMALLAACESGDGRAGAWAAALLANPLGDGSLADEQRLLESLAQSQMELAALRRRGPLPLLEARLAAGCAERVLATHGGERSITNWRHIGAILQQAWSNGQQQAADLLHCLDNPPADLDDALQRLETDRPAVRLVTIHTSKGLEYPVVFCPYLWHVSSLRMSASAKTAVLANEQGRQVLDAGSPAFGQRKKASAQEDRHELERSTYVALTRAVHRCYVGLAPVASSERGHANGAGETPLARLLCGDGDGGVLPIDSWAAHINGTGKALTLGPVNQQQGNDAVRDESTAIQTPDARGLYRAQDLTIERRTSFSSLHSSSDHLDKDRDALADRPAGDDGLLADLGSGANLGNRIHDVLELILGDGISVETALAHDTSVHKGKLQAALDTVLQAALPVGDQPLLQERWGDAPPSLTAFSTQCRCEMPFLFRVDHLDRGRLSQALLSDPAIASDPARRRWAESIARWPFARLQGFCTGSIDLVSCYQGRWYIADYKTNRLTGYERAPCESAMLEKSYLLQSRIYQVALHRHLLRALGTSYEPSRDLGGALYLFLRGWPERGLWFEEADPAAVDALDAALGGQGVRP